MLSSNDFDTWADTYEHTLNSQPDKYPFAGFGDVITCIHSMVTISEGIKILDRGYGTM